LGTSDELHAEQAHIDRAYERIDELRAAARARATDALATSVRGGQTASRLDRDALVHASLARHAALQIGDQSLCFGRLDTVAGDRFHIGRLSVTEVDGEPLVVDWRAPVAEGFYRATVHEPAGIVRRRHLRMNARTVVAIDDELLDRESAPADSELVGEAALLSALDKTRTGRMGDIVATIQAAQDRAIRAPLQGVLVVQGGPGTGKTAVALHRAAYLLYAHRLPLATQGVIVVGPNPIFCRYVENVLPGLGETGVRLATPGQLVPGVEVTAVDSVADAAIKGDATMADRLATVLAGHRRPLEKTARIGFGAWSLEVAPDESAALIDEAIASSPTYNAGRNALARGLMRVLVDKARDALARAGRVGFVGPEAQDQDRRRLVDQLRRAPDVAALLERLWSRLTADQLVDETIVAAGLPVRAARSEHDAALLDEAATLLGPRTRRKTKEVGRVSLDDALDRTLSELGVLPSCPECEAELALRDGHWECDICERRWRPEQVMAEAERRQLDEMIDRITGTHRAAPAPTERVETFGHAVVDEAQDLTPMQWRVLRRRVPSGSMTIVGDVGQSKYPWAVHSWEAVAALAADSPVEVLGLDVNYRTPQEVMDVAASVLRAIDPALQPPRSVRQSGEVPRVVKVDGDVMRRAREVAAAEAATVDGGRVAIVVPPNRAVPAMPSVLDDTIAELGVDDVKGLEFDSVIVVEPADFDLGGLYVALTRSTRRLVIVHAGELPAPLR
jgi:DNA helicase IV